MSTKSSLFLTSDNEHCYSDCSLPHTDGNGEHIGDEIVIEFNYRNITNIYQDEDSISLGIKPGTEIYDLITLMDIEHPKPVEQPTRSELIRDLKIAQKKILQLEACINATSIIQSTINGIKP